MTDASPTTNLVLDDLLCFAFHSTAQAIGRSNNPMLDKIGLTYPQYLAMIVLWAEDNQTEFFKIYARLLPIEGPGENGSHKFELVAPWLKEVALKRGWG